MYFFIWPYTIKRRTYVIWEPMSWLDSSCDWHIMWLPEHVRTSISTFFSSSRSTSCSYSSVSGDCTEAGLLLDRRRDVLSSSDMTGPWRDFELPYKNIRIYPECEGWIEKSVPRITVWHHEACRVMTKQWSRGMDFSILPSNENKIIFLAHHCFFILK